MQNLIYTRPAKARWHKGNHKSPLKRPEDSSGRFYFYLTNCLQGVFSVVDWSRAQCRVENSPEPSGENNL